MPNKEKNTAQKILIYMTIQNYIYYFFHYLYCDGGFALKSFNIKAFLYAFCGKLSTICSIYVLHLFNKNMN